MGTGGPWGQPVPSQAPAQPPRAAERGAVLGMAPDQRTCSAQPLRQPLRHVGRSAPKQTLGDIQISARTLRREQAGPCSPQAGRQVPACGSGQGKEPFSRSAVGEHSCGASGSRENPRGAPPRRAKFVCDPPTHRHQDVEQGPAVLPRAGLGSIHGHPTPAINVSRDRS